MMAGDKKNCQTGVGIDVLTQFYHYHYFTFYKIVNLTVEPSNELLFYLEPRRC